MGPKKGVGDVRCGWGVSHDLVLFVLVLSPVLLLSFCTLICLLVACWFETAHFLCTLRLSVRFNDAVAAGPK